MLDFSKKLIYWYLQNKRPLPWRNTTDPYKIWLSEIILQQTRVEQGKPYYFKFINAYPDVFSLANANEDEVLKLWEGLGYYSRARNLHTTAKYVANQLAGSFPKTYKELKTLKGVGDYTASAIASICFNEAAAVVDGNVYRVLSRVFGIETAIDSTAGKKIFKKVAQDLIDKKDPATFNQGIMEFGAIHCKPKNPYCLHCPFKVDCVAFATNKIQALPFKKGKVKTRKRYFNYIILKSKNGKTVLSKRAKNDIWQGLYEFPLIESSKRLIKNEILEEISISKITTLSQLEVQTLKRLTIKPITHKLSHQNLMIDFWEVNIDSLEGKNVIHFSEIKNLAVPRAIDRFLEDYHFNA